MPGDPNGPAPTGDEPLIVDRYAIYDAIAAGGMATVHLGRLVGTAGFLRTVAIKRLHAQYAKDPDFTAMFLDEARLASRVQHPNVVQTLDVVMTDGELLLVMEYVRGESLSRLVKMARDKDQRPPPRVVVAIVADALHGLHAAHDAIDEKGQPLGLVHRDVSPQNILVGTDGVARVLDFGVAKASGRIQSTREGDIKGKVLYMSPQQLAAEPIDRTADVYAAGVILFEALTGVRMFAGDNESAALSKIILNQIRVPSEVDLSLARFDAVVRRATAKLPADRYATARDMAVELEAVGGPPASPTEVSDWVQRLASETIDERARIVADIERSSTRSKPPIASSGSLRAAEALALAIPPSSRSGSGSRPGTGTRSGPRPAGAHEEQDVLPAGATRIGGSFDGNLARPITEQTLPSAPAAQTPPPNRSTKVMIALLGALLLGCVAVIAVLLLRKPEPPVTNAAAAGASAPGAAAQPSANEGPETPGIATAALVLRPGPSASASASASSAAAASAQAVAPPPSASASAIRPQGNGGGRPATRVSCDPPWTVDKNGHRHFIPECLK